MAQDYTAIRVTEGAKEIAEESKRDGETWNEFIQRCAENPPEVREFVEADGTNGEPIDLDAVASEVADRGESEGGAGPEQIARAVSAQLDYAELSNRVADELEGRMR